MNDDIIKVMDLGLMSEQEKQKFNSDINNKKMASAFTKKARELVKASTCLYCDREVTSFCNSHSVPEFCLRNITDDGKVSTLNSLIELPIIKQETGVCTAVDCFEYLPDDWQNVLDELHYAKDGKANFAVWTYADYGELGTMLRECISLVSELNRKTAELASHVTADLAPAHIRKTAEYIGAFVYRFNSIENLVNTLFDMGWLKSVGDYEKPAICVVKN